ncbi:hypothetical protein PRIC2_010009 [Phytophthora ramorum]
MGVDGSGEARRWDVTFWDFSGQKIYQTGHTLFYSTKALYLLCIDLDLYAKKLETMRNRERRDGEEFMQRFFEKSVLYWIRSILLCQPDAQLKLLGTKSDLVSKTQSMEVERDVNERLRSFLEDPNRQVTISNGAMTALYAQLDEPLITTNVTSDEPVLNAWKSITCAIAVKQKLSFVMSDASVQVLEYIVRLRRAARPNTAREYHLKKLIVPVNGICTSLVNDIRGLTTQSCREILHTLHDVGAISWYEDHAFQNLVILEPTIVLNLIQEVVNHEYEGKVGKNYEALRRDGTLHHSLLVTFSLWKALQELDDGLFQQLLQHFNLACPASVEDAGMIVPSYWNLGEAAVNEPATSLGSVLIRHNIEGSSVAKWKYTLPVSVSKAIFVKFAVRSYRPDATRQISGNRFECFADGEFAAVIHFISREGQLYDEILIEVAATTTDVAWTEMRFFVVAMEQVLLGYRGLNSTMEVFLDNVGTVEMLREHKLRVCLKARPFRSKRGKVVGRGEMQLGTYISTACHGSARIKIPIMPTDMTSIPATVACEIIIVPGSAAQTNVGQFEIDDVQSVEQNIANVEVDGSQPSIGLTLFMSLSALPTTPASVIHVLIACGAKVNDTNEAQQTPLMLAASCGNLSVVQALLMNKADPSLVDSSEKTALKYATRYNHRSIQRLLTGFVTNEELYFANSDASAAPKWSIPATEIECGDFEFERSIGGDSSGTWLDAKVALQFAVTCSYAASYDELASQWFTLRHPHIQKLYGALHEGYELFVCEHMTNGSLQEAIQASWLDWDAEEVKKTLRHLYEAALGLEYLHERQIVHGDIRLENVLIGSDGIAKLSTPYKVAQSGSHVAPQRKTGISLTESSDIFALGKCLEEISRKLDYIGGFQNLATECKKLFQTHMCCDEPQERFKMTAVVPRMERLIQMADSCSDRRAVLMDFGLSSSASASDQGPLSKAFRWVAPECLAELKASCASDVFSFGMCIIQAVTGKVPRDSIVDAAVKRNVLNNALPQRPEGFSDTQWQLVERMCKRDPSQRMPLLVVVDSLKQLAENPDLELAAPISTPLTSSDFDTLRLMKWRLLWIQDDVHTQRTGSVFKLIVARIEDIYNGDYSAQVKQDLTSIAFMATWWLFQMHKKQSALDVAKMLFRGFSLHRQIDRVLAEHFVVLTNEVHVWKKKSWSMVRDSGKKQREGLVANSTAAV